MSDTEPRLYLATPPSFDPEAFAPILAEALDAVPVACVRLDLGAAPEEDWTRAANHLIEVCHTADVALVVADHIRLVDALGLDGVHLASGRVTVRDARKALGTERIVGGYAGASRHQGMVLGEAGADYVSLGPVGDTGLLGDDSRADDALFVWWAEMIETPVVAEGGVTVADAQRLSEHTDFVVPDVALWQGDDPIGALKAYAAALV
ncbi:MAG: thiamine phosphate synthase [Pseudomonadota bacterium]